MKRSWAATAAAVAAMFAIAGCSQTNGTFQNNTGAQLTILSPSNIAMGSPDLTLTVSSTGGFVAKTVVQFNAQTMPTTVLDPVTVTAVIPAALLAKPGRFSVNTLNPPRNSQDNGLSNSLAFTIYGAPNPVPTITSVAPSKATACGTSCTNSSLAIVITGTNFLPTSNNGASQINWSLSGGPTQAITVNSITPTQINGTISGALLSAAGTAQINVYNPPSFPCSVDCTVFGGGFSNNLPFVVNAPGTAAVANGAAMETPALSQDGRFVAFTASQNEHSQVLLRDTCLGAIATAANCQPHTSLISAAIEGAPGNADSHSPSMSADGRFVAFSSAATNLMAGTPAGRQVFLHDTCLGAPAGCKPSLQLVSTDSDGALSGTESILPSVSASGRFVAFLAITPSQDGNARTASAGSSANSGFRQVFVRDTCVGAADCTPKTRRISLQPGDEDPSGASPAAGPAVSGGAKHVALADGGTATLFLRSVHVDDRVFVSATDNH
ncbi:MAG: hypothetical protein PVS2B2_02550 [Candidatus Acidiferrum sp.]